MSRRPSVTVEIGGEKHVIRSDVSAEYTRAVAKHVDETLRKLQPNAPLDPHRAMVLTALFITDELFRARQELETLRGEVEQRAGSVLRTLRDALTAAEAGGQPEAE